ncbi:MAG: hypothetical protein L3K03_07280 [Thermoplasmata archaeon]|nr:hypothetical protein [Thermoplasmata archaeon]
MAASRLAPGELSVPRIRGMAVVFLVGVLLVPVLSHFTAPSPTCLPGSPADPLPPASTSAGAAMLAEAKRSVVLGDSPIMVHPSTPLVAPTDGARWVNLTGSLDPVPTARYAPEMAYDAKDGYVVMFSGENLTQQFDDTWTYKNGTWTQLFPTVSPPSRAGGLFVYDPIDQYLVLFSGVDHYGGTVFGDTWTFSAGVWTNVSEAGGPGSRAEVAAAWDPVDQSIIMFGGIDNQNGSVVNAQTWRFVGGTWTQLYPTLVCCPLQIYV